MVVNNFQGIVDICMLNGCKAPLKPFLGLRGGSPSYESILHQCGIQKLFSRLSCSSTSMFKWFLVTQSCKTHAETLWQRWQYYLQKQQWWGFRPPKGPTLSARGVVALSGEAVVFSLEQQDIFCRVSYNSLAFPEILWSPWYPLINSLAA